jgi:hypothetical protein
MAWFIDLEVPISGLGLADLHPSMGHRSQQSLWYPCFNLALPSPGAILHFSVHTQNLMGPFHA